MQSILPGLGSGGRSFTLATGTPPPFEVACSSRPRYSAKRAIKPLIRSCGPVCGISRTTADTSITESPFSTPSRKSSKYSSFMIFLLIDRHEDGMAQRGRDRFRQMALARDVLDQD